MYSLYFECSNGEKVLIKKSVLENEILPLIKEFIYSKNPDFKIYYIRTWGENPIIYDVGSHTEFFYLYKE